MKLENAEGVFSDSLAFNKKKKYHFTSSFQCLLSSSLEKVLSWLRLVKSLCIKIKSALMVNPTLYFINT